MRLYIFEIAYEQRGGVRVPGTLRLSARPRPRLRRPLSWCRERACVVYTEIKLRLFTKMSISFNLSAYSILL